MCIEKYGCGRYEEIISRNFLPKKSKEQLYNKTRSIIGNFSIREFSKHRLVINKIPLLDKNEIESWSLLNFEERTAIILRKYVTRKNPEEIQIPYYRRFEDFGDIKFLEEEYESGVMTEEFRADFVKFRNKFNKLLKKTKDYLIAPDQIVSVTKIKLIKQ